MSDQAKLAQSAARQALLRVALRSAIARSSDDELETMRAKELAGQLALTDLDKSQLRALENLAYTTDKISDITDLLKRQIGRDMRERRWAKDQTGQQVLEALVALRADADRIVGELREQYADVIDPDLPRRVHLSLCREFVKHLVAEFILCKREAGEA